MSIISLKKALEALDKALQSGDKADVAQNKADNVQEQLNQAIQDGDQLAETQQARVDEKGNPHDTLKDRLDFEIGNVEQNIQTISSELSIKANRLWVDVSEYGAVGNGEIDDTDAIQSAIDSAEDGSTIYLTKTYLVSSIIISKRKDITIDGLGCGKIIRIGEGSQRTLLHINRSENIEVTNLYLSEPNYTNHYDPSTAGRRHIIRIGGGCKNIKINDNHIFGSVRDGIAVFPYDEYDGQFNYASEGFAENIFIDGNLFQNCDRCSIQVTGGERIFIRNNKMENSYQTFVNIESARSRYTLPKSVEDPTLIEVNPPVRDVVVQNNVMTNERGFFDLGTNNNIGNQVVTYDDGYEEEGFGNVLFSGNKVFGCDIGFVSSRVSNVLIEGNQFEKCFSAIAGNGTNITVTNNSFSGIPLPHEIEEELYEKNSKKRNYTIRLGGYGTLSAVNNSLTNCERYGIVYLMTDDWREGDSVLIQNNLINNPNTLETGSSNYSGVWIVSNTNYSVSDKRNIFILSNTVIANPDSNIETGRGIHFSGSGLSSIEFTDCYIVDNTVIGDYSSYPISDGIVGLYYSRNIPNISRNLLEAGGTWDKGLLILGDYYLWVDGNGDLRINEGPPSGPDSGKVVGFEEEEEEEE